ncbi:hypothetical protein CS063_06000 [Sporanaerobium hydrogeniformans]|uniref:Uncharacterized protein n=1 Tax=Sporanaerobium hydrogeniformans TaxID=3072179 RepID=A0AC61DF89_9FIRM|nr:CarD family transcriptional regulator [Sporanaerobium hydrogeniformans]PHV71242.1 hypothetical protein CS063_06000 [Sporanaerobium hydrogeniformans]
MFKVGEVVFCPMRGSGVVEAIEVRTMLGESREYVIIQMKDQNVLMMVPTEKIHKSGFRRMNTLEEADKVENILFKKEVDIDYSIDIKKRIKQNQEKLLSGSFMSCSEVVRDLSCMETIKTLNNMERNILSQAKRLLLDEFSNIKAISTEKAEKIINKLLEKNI